MTDENSPALGEKREANEVRNIIICCDGTNNQFGTRNTNVVRLGQCLERDTHGQTMYYDPGVGTLPDPAKMTRLGKWWSKVMGLAFGAGLTKDVTQAYTYLMENWEPGDRVYLFGFSRGAYTARVVAGMLHCYGLMPKGAHNLLPYVVRGFRALSDRGKNEEEMNELEDTAQDFRRTFARPVEEGDVERHFPVQFLGVWDTVSTVGWVWNPQSFRYTNYNPSVQFARHAVSVDERRAFFRQNRITPKWYRRELRSAPGGKEYERIIECWFPGTHSDVGGGHPGNEDQLWPLALEWMLDEAGKMGLRVDPERRTEVFEPADGSPSVWARKHHESLTNAWKPAEYFPKLRYQWDPESGEYRPKYVLGKGRPRTIRPGEKIHRATLLRLREEEVLLPFDKKGPYEPRSLCRKYREAVVALPEDLPLYHEYQPGENCDCEACDRLRERGYLKPKS